MMKNTNNQKDVISIGLEGNEIDEEHKNIPLSRSLRIAKFLYIHIMLFMLFYEYVTLRFTICYFRDS